MPFTIDISSCTDCPNLCPVCAGHICTHPPNPLFATIHDRGGCACLDGVVIPVYWDAAIAQWTNDHSGGGITQTNGTATACGLSVCTDSGNPDRTRYIQLELDCSTPQGTSCRDFKLTGACQSPACDFDDGFELRTTIPDAGCFCSSSAFMVKFSNLTLHAGGVNLTGCCTGNIDITFTN